MRPDVAAFFIAFLGGFLGTFVSTELVRRFAIRIGSVDQPGGRRVHRAPTARLGGLAIAVGLGVALALALGLEHVSLADPLLLGSIGGIAVALAVGVVDDVRGLGAKEKLAGQTAAAVLLWVGGWRLETIGLPGLGAIPVGDLSLPLTVLWVVGVINAVNLIDGLDGLAGGLAVVASLACAWLLAAAGDPTWILAVALAGAVAGFLWFNLPPALIFMGDAGSHLLGVMLAALGLHLSRVAPAGMFPLVPMLLIAIPIFDMAWAIARRAVAPNRAGDARPRTARAALSRVVRADGAHVHHRLLQAGWTPRAAVGLLWRAALACAVVGVTLTAFPLIALALAAGVVAWITQVAARAGAFAVAHPRPAIAVLAVPVLDLLPGIVPAVILEPEEIAA